MSPSNTPIAGPSEGLTVPQVQGGATSSLGHEIETIELVKPETGGLGLFICEKDDPQGVYVQSVVPNMHAYIDKRLRPGDRILAINGCDTSSVDQDFVFQLLQVKYSLIWSV